MKVVCLVNGSNLERGKVYDVVFESSYFYYINNQNGGQNSYIKDDLVTIEQWRDFKLKEIGL